MNDVNYDLKISSVKNNLWIENLIETIHENRIKYLIMKQINV
jgi:hypothetical protein